MLSSAQAVITSALHRLPSVTPLVLRAVLPDGRLDRISAWTHAELVAWGLPPERAALVMADLPRLDLSQAAAELGRTPCAMIVLGQPAYPAWLAMTASPPPLLYVLGDLGALQRPLLAVVGTRRPSIYGLTTTRRLVTDIARAGIATVSGLAFGIDAAAHRATIDTGTPTVAIMGTGLDQTYPWEHHQLAADIIRTGGALVTEFPFGAQPERHHFPQRNRIIAGLARAVWLVEAGEKSGALVTMKYGLDENRDLYVLPADITRPTAIGGLNWLKLGATPVTSVTDFSATFPTLGTALTAPAKTPTPQTPTEARILATLHPHEPRHIDEIIETSRLEPSVITAALAFLEIRGAVRHHGGMRYTTSS